MLEKFKIYTNSDTEKKGGGGDVRKGKKKV